MAYGGCRRVQNTIFPKDASVVSLKLSLGSCCLVYAFRPRGNCRQAKDTVKTLVSLAYMRLTPFTWKLWRAP